uniref:Uncharacterized protein n=1 Tax=Vitis vinifera TaxID=29760 RepID=F6HIA9_VITVI
MWGLHPCGVFGTKSVK